MELFTSALKYVAEAPYFWTSMGMVTSVSIFVGAIIFDGDLSMLWKGLLAVGLYAFFILQVTVTRIFTVYSVVELTEGGPNQPRIMAGVMTIFLVTLFWCIGMFIGVCVSKKMCRHCGRDNK
jgi:hypothetical protein